MPLAAFTATADAETQDEIVEKLFDALNLADSCTDSIDPTSIWPLLPRMGHASRFSTSLLPAKGNPASSIVVPRNKTEVLAQALRTEGHSACHYHGGMEAEDRRIVETRFAREDGLIVVATVAFGMGIDKPDIRWVAHSDLPKSIEAYYQEIGRAGRDGAPAEPDLVWP